MAAHKKIMVAVDLSVESGEVIEKAAGLAGPDAELHLVYVQEPMEAVYMGVVPYGPVFVGMDQVEDRLEAELKGKLEKMAADSGVAGVTTHFLSGSPAREIHSFADSHQVDLIVLGTHGQKGVQLLLGSTANSVLHGAKCDVLAVRVASSV